MSIARLIVHYNFEFVHQQHQFHMQIGHHIVVVVAEPVHMNHLQQNMQELMFEIDRTPDFGLGILDCHQQQEHHHNLMLEELHNCQPVELVSLYHNFGCRNQQQVVGRHILETENHSLCLLHQHSVVDHHNYHHNHLQILTLADHHHNHLHNLLYRHLLGHQVHHGHHHHHLYHQEPLYQNHHLYHQIHPLGHHQDH